MATWPASLPQKPLIENFSRQGQDNVYRTKMDKGKAKTRPKSDGGGIVTFTLQFILTKTQLATFDTFYNDTLSDGALSFDFPHPITGSTIDANIPEPHIINSINSTDKFRLTLKIEYQL